MDDDFDFDLFEEQFNQPEMSVDGFKRVTPPELSVKDDDELRVLAIESLIELACRAGRPVVFEVFDFAYGCAMRSRPPAQHRMPQADEVCGMAGLVGAIVDKWRQTFPHEQGMMLMPGINPETDKLETLTIIATKEAAKIMWRHGRAASDEYDHQIGEDNVERVHEQVAGQEDYRTGDDVFDLLDEQCGYYGLNLDDLPVTE